MKEIKIVYLEPIIEHNVNTVEINNDTDSDSLLIKQDGDFVYIEKQNREKFIELLKKVSLQGLYDAISEDKKKPLKWDSLSYNQKEEMRKRQPELWRKLYREKFGEL